MTEALFTSSVWWTVPALIAVLVFVWATFALIGPIISPPVLTYPWKEPGAENCTVILAGSYNPPHFGHLAMLEYLSQRCVRSFPSMTFRARAGYLVLVFMCFLFFPLCQLSEGNCCRWLQPEQKIRRSSAGARRLVTRHAESHRGSECSRGGYANSKMDF